jgi:hypothetical protein
LEGVERWKRERLNVPMAIINATDEYRGEMDVIGNFLKVPNPFKLVQRSGFIRPLNPATSDQGFLPYPGLARRLFAEYKCRQCFCQQQYFYRHYFSAKNCIDVIPAPCPRTVKTLAEEKGL